MAQNEYILIVDDDRDIRNLLGIYLENEGYRFIKCYNALSALETVETTLVSLILLDVMMPGLDGISACMKLREKTNAPIIFISAKSDDMDVVQGLMAGGDDYVVKPFNPIQLMSRVKAQLRRFRQYNRTTGENAVIEHDDLTVNTETRPVWVNGSEVTLTSKEYDILLLLLKNKNLVLPSSRIYESVWHEPSIGSENAVMMHIANLRKKLNAGGRSYIKTVWGRGYRI